MVQQHVKHGGSRKRLGVRPVLFPFTCLQTEAREPTPLSHQYAITFFFGGTITLLNLLCYRLYDPGTHTVQLFLHNLSCSYVHRWYAVGCQDSAG